MRSSVEIRILSQDDEKDALERVRFQKSLAHAMELYRFYKSVEAAGALAELGRLAGAHQRTRELEMHLPANASVASEYWDEAQRWNALHLDASAEAIKILARRLGIA